MAILSYTGREWDAVIIGGGPAGSTLATLLAQGGLRPLVIDKAVFPREKLCGGLVTRKTVDLVGEVFGLAPPELAEQGVITFESDRYALWYKSRRLILETSEFPFRLVSRPALDALLLNRAVEAGARVMAGDAVVACRPDDATVTTADGRTHTGRWLVGADGVGSLVRRSMPSTVFDPAAWRRGLAACMETTVQRHGPLADLDHPAVYFGVANHGYGWAFPRSPSESVVGIGALPAKNARPIRRLLLDFLSALGVSEADRGPLAGAAVPYGNYLLTPAAGRTLLVGDAAGLADPLLGEGIYYAMRSAQLVAGAILEAGPTGDAVARYVAAYRSAILPTMRRWSRISRRLTLGMKVAGALPVRAYLAVKIRKLPARIHLPHERR